MTNNNRAKLTTIKGKGNKNKTKTMPDRSPAR